MSNIKFTELPAASALSGADIIPIVQGGVNRRSTIGDIGGAIGPGLDVGVTVVGNGTTTRILYDNAGILGEYTVSGTGTEVALTNSPVLVIPNIGTPSAGVLTNCTGLPVAGGGTGLSSATAYAVLLGGTTSTGAFQSIASVGTSGQVLTSNGAATKPTFQALPAASLVVGTTTISSGTTTRILYDNAGVLGEYTLSGSGTVVAMATSPSFTTPALGTPTAGVLSSCTGLPLTTGVTGILPGANGGTGVANTGKTITLGGSLTTSGAFDSTFTMTNTTSVTFPTSGTLATTGGASIPTVAQGDLLYGSASNVLSALSKDTNATRYLSNKGSSNNPSWSQVTLTDGVTGVLPVANGGTNASSASITAFNNITGFTAAGATGTTSTNLVFSTSPTLTTPVINGLPTGTGVASAATASTLVSRDSSANTYANNFVQGYTTTATAGATTTLTVASTQQQFFTGSTTQTILLPVTSTLTLGHAFFIRNLSTGQLQVQSSGGNVIANLNSNTSGSFTCILTSGTTAASWQYILTGTYPVTAPQTSGNVAYYSGTSLVGNDIFNFNDSTAVLRIGAAGSTGILRLVGTSSGQLDITIPSTVTGTLKLPSGSTDFSATGGTSQVLKQVSAGAAITVAQLTIADIGTGTSTVGYLFTSYSGGTVSSGTFTPAAANGNYQYYTNNGAHTLAVPAADSAIDILITNGASAGTITFSGYTVGSNTGDTYATTNTNKYIFSIRRINGTSTYVIKALQ